MISVNLKKLARSDVAAIYVLHVRPPIELSTVTFAPPVKKMSVFPRYATDDCMGANPYSGPSTS